MDSKNRVAATLAIMAMLGFLVAFFTLGWVQVPPGNKDFLNQALIALIGMVGTAFGYYLGSSVGSAQKNEILAQTMTPGAGAASGAPTNAISAAEGGFARLRLLLPLAFLLAFLMALASIHGCAGLTGKQETPQSVAAKSLLSARQGIIAAATTADALCSQGFMKQNACNQVRELYNDAQPAYAAAADAYLLWLTINDADSQRRFEATQPQLMDLFTSLDGLVKRFSPPAGGDQ